MRYVTVKRSSTIQTVKLYSVQSPTLTPLVAPSWRVDSPAISLTSSDIYPGDKNHPRTSALAKSEQMGKGFHWRIVWTAW